MKMVTIVTILMKLNEEKTVYFNPPLLHVKEIQLIEYYNRFEGFLLFCDIVDSNYSLTNINTNDVVTLKQSKLLAIFSYSKLYPSLPIFNKKDLTKLTLAIKNKDMTTPVNDQREIFISLKIHHEYKNDILFKDTSSQRK